MITHGKKMRSDFSISVVTFISQEGFEGNPLRPRALLALWWPSGLFCGVFSCGNLRASGPCWGPRQALGYFRKDTSENKKPPVYTEGFPRNDEEKITFSSSSRPSWQELSF
jgi:hypothetical protein